jgi:hypothetical protein
VLRPTATAHGCHIHNVQTGNVLCYDSLLPLLLLLQAARGLGRGKDFTFVTSDVAELVPVVKHMQQVCVHDYHSPQTALV